MRSCLTILLFIVLVASYIEQRMHIRDLQGEIMDCRVSLRDNERVSEISKQKMMKIMEGLGLSNIEANLAIYGE